MKIHDKGFYGECQLTQSVSAVGGTISPLKADTSLKPNGSWLEFGEDEVGVPSGIAEPTSLPASSVSSILNKTWNTL
jgi:hypothetical protein